MEEKDLAVPFSHFPQELMKQLILALIIVTLNAVAAEPQQVHFPSEDKEKTKLDAYLFEPEPSSGRHPAVVLLHGRSGLYSSQANGVYNAETLSKRHKFYAKYWTERGYVVLLIDSFGPRGFIKGFPKDSHSVRPPEVSEEHRPFDAYAGLRYLRTCHNVDSEHVFVQGWSNGAMTALVAMGTKSPGLSNVKEGFRAAITEYPGCHMESVQGNYHAYAPILLVLGTDDDEVGYKFCQQWSDHARELGNKITTILEEGAQHDFDEPSKSKQAVPANRKAMEDMTSRAEPFFAKFLR
jgi:dienelactone hydrolase